MSKLPSGVSGNVSDGGGAHIGVILVDTTGGLHFDGVPPHQDGDFAYDKNHDWYTDEDAKTRLTFHKFTLVEPIKYTWEKKSRNPDGTWPTEATEFGMITLN